MTYDEDRERLRREAAEFARLFREQIAEPICLPILRWLDRQLSRLPRRRRR